MNSDYDNDSGDTFEFNIFHFNDVYNVEADSTTGCGGLSQFYTALTDAISKSKLENLILFSGDLLSPSILSNSSHGKHMIEAINYMNIDAAVIGNHDFDFGVDNFIECSEMSNFKWINSNCWDKYSNAPLGDCNEWMILEKGNVKVGIIGLVEQEWIDTLSTVDAEDLCVDDFVEKARELTQVLIESPEHQCDFVICLTHMRWPNDRLLAQASNTNLQLILGGHDHNYGVEKCGDCTIVKSGTDFREFSRIHIRGNKKNRRIDIVEIEKIEVEPSKYPSNPIMDEVVSKMTAHIEMSLSQVLGKLDVDLDSRFESVRLKETNVGNWITDIILTSVDADCAILNSGSFRSDKIIPAGPFTMKDLHALLPIIDPIVVLEVPGDILLLVLENGVSMVPKLEGRFPQVSGIEFSFNPNSQPRIDANTVFIQKQLLDPTKKYRLATKYYLAQGKDGYDLLSNCKVLLDDENGPTLNLLIQNYFQTINVLSGFKTLRYNHYQKLLSRSRVHRMKMDRDQVDGASKWNVIKSLIRQMQLEHCSICPKIESRIQEISSE